MNLMSLPRYIYGLVLAGLVLSLDQWTKLIVLGEKRFNAIECLHASYLCGGIELSPIMDFTMVWNRGISFGMVQSEGIMRWVLVFVGLIVTCVFLVWLVRTTTVPIIVSLGLIIGGAVGNVIDRVRFGAVVDFLDFSDIYFFYVFNVGDASITCGAALLLIDHFILSRHEKNTISDQNVAKEN